MKNKCYGNCSNYSKALMNKIYKFKGKAGEQELFLFPKSSTLVLRLSILQDTIPPVFYINRWLLLQLLSKTPHHDISNLLLLLIK